MSFKTHPSEKSKYFKFDEYKLLDNQIEMLADVMDKMNTRHLGKQRGTGRAHRNHCSFDKSYDRGRENFRQMSYDRDRRGYSSIRDRSRS